MTWQFGGDIAAFLVRTNGDSGRNNNTRDDTGVAKSQLLCVENNARRRKKTVYTKTRRRRKKIKTRGHTRKHSVLRYVFNGREKLTLFRTSMLQLSGDRRRLVKTNITRIVVYCWVRRVVTGNRYVGRRAM